MTREFAKLVLSSLATWEGQERMITAEQVEAIKVLSQEPFLPSNIDEVAWEYFLKTYGIDNIAISEDIKRAVKFGAKWMAEQGYTQEGIAHLDDHEVWVDIKNTDIKDGDKVIVQIRRMTNK